MEKGFGMQQQIMKFAITGPESTGKSTLTQQLADEFQTLWVPEFARDFLHLRKGKYSENDLLTIAEGQMNSEKAMELQSDRILFCDTEFLVIKIWSLVKYGRCHPRILSMIEEQNYLHYFLCDIDIPWQDDPLREHPHMRKELFDLYVHELNKYQFPYTVISGNHEERLQMARQIVQKKI
jgi:NadR type nicotinamide-nucleotide adenylyltransferase